MCSPGNLFSWLHVQNTLVQLEFDELVICSVDFDKLTYFNWYLFAWHGTVISAVRVLTAVRYPYGRNLLLRLHSPSCPDCALPRSQRRTGASGGTSRRRCCSRQRRYCPHPYRSEPPGRPTAYHTYRISHAVIHINFCRHGFQIWSFANSSSLKQR